MKTQFGADGVLPVAYNNFDVTIQCDLFICLFEKRKTSSKTLNNDNERQLR